MIYLEMRTALADALSVEREDVRCNDMTGMWCVKTSRQREICTVAQNAESAAIAIRVKMEELS